MSNTEIIELWKKRIYNKTNNQRVCKNREKER